MLLEPKSYALGSQKLCSWKPKAMLLEPKSYALGGQKLCSWRVRECHEDERRYRLRRIKTLQNPAGSRFQAS